MANRASPISEETALFERRRTIGAPDTRLAADDPLLELGDAFIVNGLVTPTATAAARLIPREVTAGVSTWLHGSLARAEDDLYLDIDDTVGEHSAVATIEAVRFPRATQAGACPSRSTSCWAPRRTCSPATSRSG